MTDQPKNGNGEMPPVTKMLEELQELGERERIAARRESVRVVESLSPSAVPFDQKAHDLMIKGIDQVATDWVAELEHARQNSKRVEQLVIERAAKVKNDITALYLLGSAALAEAKRGDDINAKLTTELDKLSE
jgi:hypothetical protein